MSSDHRIYPSIPEYTPLSKNVYVRPSQYLHPPPPEYTPPFSTTICNPPRIYPSLSEINIPPPFQLLKCDIPRIYPSIPEYTPLSKNVYVQPSQYPPLLPRIYPPFSTIICDTPRIYPPLALRIYPSLQQLHAYYYATIPEFIPPSQNIPPFSTTICDPPRIYPFLQEYTPRPFYNYMRYSKNYMYKYETIYHLLPELKKVFWEGEVDPGRVAYSC